MKSNLKTNNQGFGALLVIVTVAILVILGVVVYKNFSGGNRPVTTTKVVNASPLVSASVEITQNGFNPSTIQVKKGTQVTFVNKDKKQHQPASDPYPTHTQLPGFFSPSPLNTDDSYSFVFEKAGTFTYQDYLNPLKIKGTVIVTD